VRYILTAMLLSSSMLFGQNNAQVPRVLGVAHVAFRVSDLSRTGAFYKNLLGYAEPFSLNDANGNPAIAFVKVNDEQYVELFPGDAASNGQLDHFALYTNDLAGMRQHLLAQQIPLLRDIHVGRVGNSFLTIRDPDGHYIEILQYSSTSLSARSQGKFMPSERISNHITHVGILVSSVGSAMKFYRDILGFRELSRGGGGGQPDWVNVQVPDGGDYIELLPFAGVASAVDLKTQNHFGLASSDVSKTVASLQQKTASSLLSSPISVLTGGGLPPRANLFDPDGARVELIGPSSAVLSSPTSSSP